MIVIKGNLILKRQAQGISSETSSDALIAFANLGQFNISNALIIEGDVTISNLTDDIIIVTGEITDVGGTYE